MGKENIQFSFLAKANNRMKELMLEFSDKYELDMHEYEKNLFCLAYIKGFEDAQKNGNFYE